MRTVLRLLLRLFPDDVDGILRGEMEETFLDGYRASSSRLRFAGRELLSLFRNGLGERVRRGSGRVSRGVAGSQGEGGSSPGPHHRSSPVSLASTLRDDLRLALRKLSRSLGFSAAAVLTLAVGIGCTVAMFGILEAALLRSLPYPDPRELALGRATFQGRVNMTCSFPDYLSHKEGSDAFEEMAAVFSPQRYTLTGGEVPVRVAAHWVTANFFGALEVPPALGRTFLPEEGEPDGPDVVVISHGLWQRWFGGDPGVVGKTLTMAGVPTTVIGVMPASFRFMYDSDLWAPVRMGMFDTEGRRSHSWQVVGRLRDDVTLEEAQAQMDVISAQLAEAYPESHTGKGMGFVPLGEGLAENYRPGILLLMGATTLLLLIACGNVAGLLAARATARRVELSVRSALGASRRVLVRQLLVESLLIALLAGVLGSFLAFWIQRATLAAVPLELLGVRDVGLSGGMLSFALVASLTTALLFGTGPAFSASRAEPAEELKGSRTSTGGRKGGRTRGALVVAQVALSVVLLTGSGLLIRSFVRLRAVDLGFRTNDLVTANVSISEIKYEDPASRTRFFQGVLDDVRALPGVTSAAFTNKIPILHRWTNWFIWDADNPPEVQEDRLSTYSRTVLPGYFETLGIPVLRGRDNSLDDGSRAEPYLVISQSAAEALFPGQDPVGRRIGVFNGMGEAVYEVLGVVADFRITSVDREPRPQMYFSHSTYPNTTMHLMARTGGDPGSLVAEIRRAVRERDPDVPLENVSTMEEIVGNSIAASRTLSIATALFAVTALFLSLTGLYAVLAFHVGRRTREIGIRAAFGATGASLSGMVVRRGLALVALGLLLGILGAGAAARALRSQLYQVGPLDPGTFGCVAGGFLVVGALAALLPARRAARVDPVRAMQVE
ncbi:MAG: ABC transporter permease [Longimicrobiales bacterium]